MLAERSRTVEGVNAAGSGVCADFGVECCLIGSELAHIAEYGHFSSLRLFQNIERCLHRNRVCVVAVIDNGVFSCLDDVESSAHRLQCLDSLFDLLQRQPVRASDCGSGQRIVNHMASRNRNQCRKAPLRGMNPAGNAAEALALDLIGIIFVLFIQSEMNRLDAVNRSNSRQLIIVPIDDNVPVLTQMIKDLGLRL